MGFVQTTKRVIRFGGQSYIRNAWLSLATTVIVAMTLFIISVFVLNVYATKLAMASVENKLDMAVYINDAPSEADVTHFVDEIKQYPEVKEAVYLDKEAVIKEWNQLNLDSKIKNQITPENNPLPRTIKIKATDPEQLDAIATKITNDPFSSNVQMSYRDNRPLIQQLTQEAKQTTRNGIIVSIIFTIIAVTFIYNTIRIVIHFRNDEIGIMKLVGAKDSFIRGPFLVEGILYGFFAGIIAFGGLYFYLRNGLTDAGGQTTGATGLVAAQVFSFFQLYMVEIFGILVSVAILLSMACTWISVRHHLRR